MAKILLVEDDKDLNKTVELFLLSDNYQVTSCYDGQEALIEFKNNKYDLILTDIMMPNLDGFSLADKIRNVDKQVPIIFMTAKDDKLSKQLGYKLEIDDYITKPFDIDELVLRVKAVLRRTRIKETKKISIGNLVMDFEEHTAYVDGKELNFTVREFDILYKLLSNPKHTFTRSQLMEEFWDFDSSATSRTVDVYMAKLRDKTSICSGFEILTVHGLGYKAVLNEK